MIKELFQIEETNFGYILKNSHSKYVLNKTKKINSSASYYLKLVEPFQKYVTGLFYKKKYDFFQGKDINGKIVKVKIINNQSGYITII